MTRLNPEALADLFADIDTTYFVPHPMTLEEARRIAAYPGPDVYMTESQGSRYISYGMIRGIEAGYKVPSLGVAVRRGFEGQGHGRRMMLSLHELAVTRLGLTMLRLRVHPDNDRAKRLYERMGYVLVAYERDEEVMVAVFLPGAAAWDAMPSRESESTSS